MFALLAQSPEVPAYRFNLFDLVFVIVDGDLWFQLPGSDDLVGKAVVIPCNERPPGIRLENNRWIGAENREVNPQQLNRPNKVTQGQFLLEAPKTFYTTMDEETGVSTGADKEKERRASRYQRDLENSSIQGGYLSGGLEFIKNTTSKVHKSAKEIYNSTVTSIGKGLEKVFFSVVQLLMWIAAPVIVILLCVCFIYLYFKFRAFRRAAKLTKRATRDTANVAIGLAAQATQALARINNVHMDQRAHYEPVVAADDYSVIKINAVVNQCRFKIAKLPHIDVNMEGKILEALVDSGAAVSYMPLSSVRTKINSSIVPPAQAANGSSIPFLGTTQATIKIGDFYIPHTFLVSRDGDCPAPLLLGTDFVNEINKNHDFSINVHKGYVKIGACEIQLNAATVEEKIEVFPQKETIIEPQSEAVFPAIIPNYTEDMGTELYMEDTQEDSNDVYAVGRVLARIGPKGKIIPSCEMNQFGSNQSVMSREFKRETTNGLSSILATISPLR
uniref:Peptidase A2 domain-containing protein n=1 Tax=Caenorhabditis japonica TaxID=281687 RepID=A0A8R1DWF4_CAEJA